MTPNPARSLRLARRGATVQSAAAALVSLLGMTFAGFAFYTTRHHPQPDSLAGLGVALGLFVAAFGAALALLFGVLAHRLPHPGARTGLTAAEVVLAVVLFGTARQAFGNPVAALVWLVIAASAAAVLTGLADARPADSVWRRA